MKSESLGRSLLYRLWVSPSSLLRLREEISVTPRAKMLPTNDDLHIMALTIIGEARGEGDMGMIAVAHVIKNRAILHSKRPVDVCLQRIQFSCWNAVPENVRNLATMAGQLLSGVMYVKARSFAEAAFEPGAIDPTKGANHYHAYTVSPAWADRARLTATIGNHMFYRL